MSYSRAFFRVRAVYLLLMITFADSNNNSEMENHKKHSHIWVSLEKLNSLGLDYAEKMKFHLMNK